jgi:plastocyanin
MASLTAGLVVLVGLAVMLSGCAPGAAARAGAAQPVTTTTVDMPRSYRFEPVSVQVTAGSTVTWTNSDNFTHSVQVNGQSDVKIAKPGESVSITFAQPGTYSYRCTFHPQDMRGTVIVS